MHSGQKPIKNKKNKNKKNVPACKEADKLI